MPSDAGLVTDICGRWEEARRQGHDLPAEELCRDHPELIDDVRRAIRNLTAADAAIRTAPAGPSGVGDPELPADGRYRLVRFLAVPRELDDLCRRALAADPADRIPSAEALAAEVERYLARTDPAAVPPRPPRRWPWIAAAVVAAAAAVVFAANPFADPIRVETPTGTLVIESDAPDVEVVVRKDGVVIREKARMRELVLTVGDYTIELAEAKDGLRLSTDKFVITKDGKATVRVRLEKKPPAVGGNADRAAAAEFLKHIDRVSLRLKSGAAVQIDAGKPLPDEPFTVLRMSGGKAQTFPNGFASKVLLPHAAKLTGLQVVGQAYRIPLTMTEAELEELAGLPCRESILELHLRLELSPRVAETLKRFPKLRVVTLTAAADDDAALAALKDLPTLTVLALNDVGKSGKVTAAGWESVTGLRLNALILMGGRGVDAEVCKRIAGMPTLTARLVLDNCGLDDAAIRELAKCKKLSELYIGHNVFNDAWAADLAKVGGLETLSFRNVPIGDGGLMNLAACKTLRIVKLMKTAVTPEGVKKFGEANPNCRVEMDAAGP